MQSQTPPPGRKGPHTLEEVLRALPRQYIKVLRRPSIATFSEEMGSATWSLVGAQILGWMTCLGICGLLIILIKALVLGLTGSLDLTGLGSTFGLTLLLALLIPMLLLVDTVLVYLLARAFGGRGTLAVQSYACLLFQIPLSTIGSLLAFIPSVGIFLCLVFGFGAFIYGMLLQIFAVIAVHRLDARTAVVTIFIPALVTLTLTWLLIAFISPTFAFAAGSLQAFILS
jgi:Yip1 domain